MYSRRCRPTNPRIGPCARARSFPGIALRRCSPWKGPSIRCFTRLPRAGSRRGATSVAAVSGRIGANPTALVPTRTLMLSTFSSEVFGKQSLTDLPASVQSTAEGLADIRGPLRTGSTLTENLLLEYAEGMTGKDLGWAAGRRASQRDYGDPRGLRRSRPTERPISQTFKGRIYWTIFCILWSRLLPAKPVAGALGKVADRVLIFAGHDTNISHVSGLLNLSWLLSGLPA